MTRTLSRAMRGLLVLAALGLTTVSPQPASARPKASASLPAVSSILPPIDLVDPEDSVTITMTETVWDRQVTTITRFEVRQKTSFYFSTLDDSDEIFQSAATTEAYRMLRQNWDSGQKDDVWFVGYTDVRCNPRNYPTMKNPCKGLPTPGNEALSTNRANTLRDEIMERWMADYKAAHPTWSSAKQLRKFNALWEKVATYTMAMGEGEVGAVATLNECRKYPARYLDGTKSLCAKDRYAELVFLVVTQDEVVTWDPRQVNTEHVFTCQQLGTCATPPPVSPPTVALSVPAWVQQRTPTSFRFSFALPACPTCSSPPASASAKRIGWEPFVVESSTLTGFNLTPPAGYASSSYAVSAHPGPDVRTADRLTAVFSKATRASERYTITPGSVQVTLRARFWSFDPATNQATRNATRDVVGSYTIPVSCSSASCSFGVLGSALKP